MENRYWYMARGCFVAMTRRIDRPLLLCVGLLSSVGLVTLYSAAPDLLLQGIRNLLFGFFLMCIVANISPQTYMSFAPIVYCIGIGLLLAVFFVGDTSRGAQRWLNVGFSRIQPSELMKIAVPLALAWYFQKIEPRQRLHNFLVGTVILVIPVLLILKQPDLGTAMLVLAAGSVLIFLAGLSSWVIMLLGIALLLLMPFACYVPWPNLIAHPMLHPYQCRRLVSFINPDADPLGVGYHTIQSTIAIGSGGLNGKGWLHGTQTHLEFVPERHTDFIFAVIAEEYGFVRCAMLLGLYFFCIVRGAIIAANARTVFTRLLSSSLFFIFFVSIFVNIGMVSGMLPVVGVPLPLISYGGTSMATVFVALGMLSSVHYHRCLLNT